MICLLVLSVIWIITSAAALVYSHGQVRKYDRLLGEHTTWKQFLWPFGDKS